jgi:hypothetical protein
MKLKMSGNGISVGAKAIAMAIARNQTLDHVDLSHCKIEDLGGFYFFSYYFLLIKNFFSKTNCESNE